MVTCAGLGSVGREAGDGQRAASVHHSQGRTLQAPEQARGLTPSWIYVFPSMEQVSRALQCCLAFLCLSSLLSCNATVPSLPSASPWCSRCCGMKGVWGLPRGDRCPWSSLVFVSSTHSEWRPAGCCPNTCLVPTRLAQAGLELQLGRGYHPAGTGVPTAAREKQPVLEELRAVTTQEQECWTCLSSSSTGTTDPALLHWLPLAFQPSGAPAARLQLLPFPLQPSLFPPGLGGRSWGRVASTEIIPQHRKPLHPEATLPRAVPSIPWLIHNDAVQTAFISGSDHTTPSRKTKPSSQCQAEMVWSKGKKTPQNPAVACVQCWSVWPRAGRAVPRRDWAPACST